MAGRRTRNQKLFRNKSLLDSTLPDGRPFLTNFKTIKHKYGSEEVQFLFLVKSENKIIIIYAKTDDDYMLWIVSSTDKN